MDNNTTAMQAEYAGNELGGYASETRTVTSNGTSSSNTTIGTSAGWTIPDGTNGGTFLRHGFGADQGSGADLLGASSGQFVSVGTFTPTGGIADTGSLSHSWLDQIGQTGTNAGGGTGGGSNGGASAYGSNSGSGTSGTRPHCLLWATHPGPLPTVNVSLKVTPPVG